MAATNLVTSVQHVVWRISAIDSPRVRRLCSVCGAVSQFRSTDKFRINAHKRRLDVWLIYACERCDTTWNCPIHRRVPCDAVDRGDYERWLYNHRPTAWQHAFDVGLLQRAGARIDLDVPYRVAGAPLRPNGTAVIHVQLLDPVSVRPDQLVARQLGVSRAQVQRWARRQQLAVLPAHAKALRRPLRTGQRLVLRDYITSAATNRI